jgi:prepilin-type N-terminal cleavage/methylation domain-containing protein
MKRISRLARGFTMVELMIVVSLIAVLAAIAIPGYQKFTAKSRRTEMYTSMSKVRLYFKNIHDAQGTFSTPQTLPPSTASAVNPSAAVPPGRAAPWISGAAGWLDVTGVPEGAIRMRYWYTMGNTDGTPNGPVHKITLQACGTFPGFGPTAIECVSGMFGNYLYTEDFFGTGTSEIVESPEF